MSQKGVWTVAVVLLLIGLGAGYFVGQYTAPTKEVIVEVPVEVPVYPLSGEIPIGVVSPTDTGMKYYPRLIELVEEEINDYIETLGHDFTVKFYLENAKASPTTALEKIQSLNAMGIKVVLGMTYSSHIKTCYDYVQEQKIIIISDHSTAPELAIPDDYVFRICPDDTLRGPILAKALEDLGIEAVVAIQRGDAWGDGMYESFENSYEALGGVITELIRYAPDAKEFSAEVALANDELLKAIDTYGKEKVAIQMFSFSDESLIILPQAAEYPTMLEVLWFDGERATRVVETGDMAITTKWISPVDAPTASPKYVAFGEMFREEFAEDPIPWYANFWDSAWITTLSIIDAASYDTEVLKEVIPRIASQYFGTSGWCNLNEAGDKFSDYDIQMIKEVEGVIKYVAVGRYTLATGTVEWLVPIEELKP
ncbi:MAG: ABC transporter substrate-binding protein [Dehalococcoidia bacterium]|nr:ABC transporter substrate-binding protein [Dehalococcoidia bacterium]